MSKRRKVNQRQKQRQGVKVTLPSSSWDRGTTGLANRESLVIEDAGDFDPDTGKVVNPNGVKRARRVDMLEVYYKRGWISSGGFTAGEKLRDAWEATQRGPGWADNDRVQSSPKPDQAITMQIDRLSRFIWISHCVPEAHAVIIEHVALHSGSIGGVKVRGKAIYGGSKHEAGRVAMWEAFDALAHAMGY